MDAEGMKQDINRLLEEAQAECDRRARVARETRYVDITWFAYCTAMAVTLSSASLIADALAELGGPAKEKHSCN